MARVSGFGGARRNLTSRSALLCSTIARIEI
jgi:hypothetical protein